MLRGALTKRRVQALLTHHVPALCCCRSLDFQCYAEVRVLTTKGDCWDLQSSLRKTKNGLCQGRTQTVVDVLWARVLGPRIRSIPSIVYRLARGGRGNRGKGDEKGRRIGGGRAGPQSVWRQGRRKDHMWGHHIDWTRSTEVEQTRDIKHMKIS